MIATVEEFPLEQCQEEFLKIPRSKLRIGDTQICVHSPGNMSDTCQGETNNAFVASKSFFLRLGDSGGPLEYTMNRLHYIYGITSYGLGCGSAFPSVYTRVDKYLSWIDEKINL